MNDIDIWIKFIDKKIVALNKNNTWDLVPFPKGNKLIDCKWVFKKKSGLHGSIENHKHNWS